MCEANKAMFATISKFNKQQVDSLYPLSVQRLVDNEGAEKPGSWYILKMFFYNTCVHMVENNSYYGQLTNLGRFRMTSLGQRLREVYVNK